MKNISAVIGGTGLSQLAGFQLKQTLSIDTPYGPPSSSVLLGELNAVPICFLARHGNPHRIPPHRINYRANIWALKSLGVERIIAVNAVGGIDERMGPGHLTIPDQLIDYTSRRVGSFCDDDTKMPMHIDFTYPFDEKLRQVLICKASDLKLDFSAAGIYACTEGPRLESAAEINRLERDGAAVVGMTAMPEAALAREKEIAYASISLVVNKAAGRSNEEITMEDIEKVLATGMGDVQQLLHAVLSTFSEA